MTAREALRRPRAWRIRHSNGTYYAGPSGIGPRFGATRRDAATFASAEAASRSMLHWAFAVCHVEDPGVGVKPTRRERKEKRQRKLNYRRSRGYRRDARRAAKLFNASTSTNYVRVYSVEYLNNEPVAP